MSGQWEGGKGDTRRPTDRKLFDAGYMAAFAKTPDERKKWSQIWHDLRTQRKEPNDPTN